MTTRELIVHDPNVQIIKNADETLTAVLEVNQRDKNVTWSITFPDVTEDQLRCLADQFYECTCDGVDGQRH